eukprot:4112314-Prymnesium_polylepis.1
MPCCVFTAHRAVHDGSKAVYSARDTHKWYTTASEVTRPSELQTPKNLRASFIYTPQVCEPREREGLDVPRDPLALHSLRTVPVPSRSTMKRAPSKYAALSRTRRPRWAA